MLKKVHCYIIKTAAPISVLGGITGPINKPVQMKPYDAYKAVCEGHEVYEVNQYNPSEKCRVTKTNYTHISFKTTKGGMIARKKLNNEIQSMSKKEAPLKSSRVDIKESKKKELEKNEGKADVESIKAVEAESAFKETDFQKIT